jgi:hypothetical protein
MSGMQYTRQFLGDVSGSVARTVQDKQLDVVSAMDALSSAQRRDVRSRLATLDLAAALAPFLLAAAVAGVAVHCPGGIWRANSEVAVDASNVRLYGDGPDNTIFVTSHATQNLFSFGSATPRAEVYLSGMGFTTDVTRTAGAYVKFNNITHGGVSNFRSFGGHIVVEQVNSVLIRCRDAYIIYPTAGTGVGFRIRGGNDHSINDVLVTGDPAAECLAAVQIEATGATWLHNVGGLHCGIGLLLQPTTPGDVVEHVFSSECAWDNCDNHGILIDAAAGTIVRRCKSVQDWAATNDAHGVIGSGAGTIQDIEFIGLRSYNNALHGLVFTAGADIRVMGGTFAGNSRTTPNTFDGIAFDAVNGASVIGARSGAAGAFGATQRYGVNLNSTTNYVVALCNLQGNTTGPFLSASGVTATTIVRDNIGYVSQNTGLQSGATTNGSGDITITHGCAATPGRVFIQPQGAGAVYAWTVHTIGATTFTARFFNVAAAGAPLAAFALDPIAWRAEL